MSRFKWKKGTIEPIPDYKDRRYLQKAEGLVSLIHIDRKKWEKIFGAGVGRPSALISDKGLNNDSRT